MATTIKCQRTFVDWGDRTRDFERSEDVLRILTDVMVDLEQTIGAYIGGKFTSIGLHEGDSSGIEADLDLIFVNRADGYRDIVLRKNGETAYGGALNPSKSVQVSDEIVNGFRVLIGIDDGGNKTRYEVIGGQYNPVGPAAAASLTNPARAKMRRAAEPA